MSDYLFKRSSSYFKQYFVYKQFLRNFQAPIQSINLTSKGHENEENENSDYNYLGINIKTDSSILYGQYSCYDKIKFKEQLYKKYMPLIQPKKRHTVGNRKNIGLLNMRFDSENIPHFHGEYEKCDKLLFETFDQVVSHINNHYIDLPEIKMTEDNVIADKYLNDDFEEIIEEKPSKVKIKSFIDEKIQFRHADKFLNIYKKIKNIPQKDEEDWISYQRSKREPKNDFKIKPEPTISEKLINVKLEQSTNINKPEILSGYEYLKKVHSGKLAAYHQQDFDELKKFTSKEKLDSKGYRLLTNQIPDFSKLTNTEIVDLLEKQIIFNDVDIVAINKPYGISVHADLKVDAVPLKSTSRVNSKFSHVIHLGYFLPELAARLGCSKLYTVHRLDRDTTGVLILTKTQEKAKLINNLFKDKKIEKKYLCVTKNKPTIPEGIIKIPIELGYIKSKGRKRERMVLCPEPMSQIRLHRKWRNAKLAITHYKIRSNNGNATLLEVTPETGVRHQIRVHLGFGLRCPILGDHKYSNLDSISPQKLPADILMALRVRQAKSRTVPMHLHSYITMIPQAGKNGSNIFLRAPLPYHFRKNMHSLKLRLD